MKTVLLTVPPLATITLSTAPTYSISGGSSPISVSQSSGMSSLMTSTLALMDLHALAKPSKTSVRIGKGMLVCRRILQARSNTLGYSKILDILE